MTPRCLSQAAISRQAWFNRSPGRGGVHVLGQREGSGDPGTCSAGKPVYIETMYIIGRPHTQGFSPTCLGPPDSVMTPFATPCVTKDGKVDDETAIIKLRLCTERLVSKAALPPKYRLDTIKPADIQVGRFFHSAAKSAAERLDEAAGLRQGFAVEEEGASQELSSSIEQEEEEKLICINTSMLFDAWNRGTFRKKLQAFQDDDECDGFLYAW